MADDGQQQGGDGQQAAAKTFTEAEFNERLAAFETEKAAILAKRDEALTEAKTAKAKARELELSGKAHKAGVTSEELDRLRAEIRADFEKGEWGQFKTKAEELAAENRQLKLDNVVKAAMAKSGVRAERVDDLFRLKAAEFDLTEDGKPMLRNRMGTPVEKYLAEDLSKEYPEFYQGSGSSGGGASRSAAGGLGPRSISRSDSKAFLSNLDGLADGSVKLQ